MRAPTLRLLNDVIYQNGKPSKLKTTFILHDTYGLDMEDLKKFGALPSIVNKPSDIEAEIRKIKDKRTTKQEMFSMLLGNYFYVWWILQYYHGCVPLWVKLRIDNVEITL